MFGEKALLQDQSSLAKRTATIIAHEPLDLIVIHRKDFTEVLKNLIGKLQIRLILSKIASHTATKLIHK